MSLKREVAWSTVWSAVQIGGNQITSFVVFIALTRFLRPEEIGVVAIAAAFIDIGLPLMRGGFPESVVQRAELDKVQADTCFWTTMASSIILTLAIIALAPSLSLLFDAPSFASVLQVLALMFPLSALTATHEALIIRSFGFKSLALRSIIANTVGGVVGLGAAWMGYGVWSLVVQRIVTSIVSIFVIWASYRWLPRLRFSKVEFVAMARFGLNMMGITFLSSLNGRATDFVLGFFLGPQAVGYVRVASRCLDMVTQFAVSPLTSVALTTFSRLQDDQPRFERAVARMVQVCGVLSFPAYFGLGMIAGDLVPLVFGPQWAISGTLLPILSLFAFPNTLQYFTWPALAAKGRSDKAAIGIFIIVATSVAATGLAAPFGLVAVATANVARSYLTLPIGFYLLRRYAGVRPLPMIIGSLRPLGAAVAMVALLWLGRPLLADLSPWLRVLTMSVAGAAIYAGLLLTFCRPLLLELRNVVGR